MPKGVPGLRDDGDMDGTAVWYGIKVAIEAL
jgi:hypothetical protein